MRTGATFGRRSFLNVIAGSGVASVQAFGKQDSWQLKPPSEWTPEEINWILNGSPWVQSAEVFFSRARAANYPQETPSLLRNPPKFEVRWESAQPVLDALRLPKPAAFQNYYVLRIPDNRWFRRELKPPRFPESLSALKRATGLKFEEESLQAEKMEDILNGSNKGVMFYFPRRKQITARLDSVLFVTAIGNMEITARFRPTGMIYRGELAV